ncbi:MAG: serine/threonine-protein kinase, partial [Acidobacteriota bacterium]
MSGSDSNYGRVAPIDSARWRRVAGVIGVVLELDAATRAAYLASLAGQNPELHGQVLGILRHVGALPSRRSPGDEPTVAEPRHRGRERNGPYRLITLLGRGGMGAVFLAHRDDDEFERRVAIKIIDSGVEAPTVYQRFISERQILASFDHPNIARLYDGGTADDGRPYFVMEHIDGVPIDRFCFERGLSLDDRLAVFRKVGDAVAYAHRQRVVHRDLKPSNILVTPAGEPKLLDFGIAKLLDPEAWPQGHEGTRTSLRPMTPNWASPEQLYGKPISRATDIYSLGLLLYKLTTGRLPFGTRRTVAEALESLEAVTRTPREPSRVIAEDGPDSGAWPDVDAGALAEAMRSGVDAVVLRALRFEGAERYGSVEAMLDDLERGLETGGGSTGLRPVRRFPGRPRLASWRAVARAPRRVITPPPRR